MERVAEWICEPCKKIVHRVEILEDCEEVLWRLRDMHCGLCGELASLTVRRKEEVSEEETQAQG